jgi:hypothetical protein
MRVGVRPSRHRRRAVRGWLPALVVIALAPGAALVGSAATAPGTVAGATPGAVAQTAPPWGGTGAGDAVRPALDLSGPQFGIAYGDVLPWMTPARLAAALHDAVAVGATWVRLDFSWADVQPNGPTSFHWAGLDRVVSMARSLGLNVLPTLAYTPGWARARSCASDKCPPASDAAFARFARAAAARYAGQGVRAWEIWNEENSPGFWAPAPDATRYVALLDATAAAIRSVDPGAFIISGGLTATLTLKGAVDTRLFLEQMCALGANRVVDAVGYHPYTYPYLATFSGTWATAWNKIAQTPVSIASILAQYGTPDLPVWLTEYGAPSTSSTVAGASDTAQVTEARQAQIAASAVSAVVSSTSIGALFWYTDQDLPGSRPVDHYGLRSADGTAKPAFTALRDAIIAARAALSSEAGSAATTPG